MKDKFYIAESQIHGLGIFTSVGITKGTQLFVAAYNDFVKGKFRITNYGKMVNHQKNGNCELKKLNDSYILVAIKDIKSNEELISDYSKLEYPFKSNVSDYKEL